MKTVTVTLPYHINSCIQLVPVGERDNAARMHGTLNMAFKVIFLTVLVLIATHCTAEQTQYSEALCKLLPVEDVASQFKLLAKEKGVRMIYLNLDLPFKIDEEFLPWRWVWAKSISEPMLSLPYDYDILSLGLLNYQVKSILKIQLQDYPRGCFVHLNRSSGRDEVIGGALLKNVTTGNFGGELQREGEVVCVAVVNTSIEDFFDGNVVFQCCKRDNQAPEQIRCKQPITKNSWLVAFTYVLNVLTIPLIFYCPALPLALPSCMIWRRKLRKRNYKKMAHKSLQTLRVSTIHLTKVYFTWTTRVQLLVPLSWVNAVNIPRNYRILDLPLISKWLFFGSVQFPLFSICLYRVP